jgi:hypothetical protein
LTDTERNPADKDAPGGRASRGPEYGTGNDVQADVPPYDDLRGEPGTNSAPAAFDASNAPAPDASVPVSDEERSGMSSTDMNPQPQHGVGESTTSGGEEQAPDRPDVGTKGPAQRPVGSNADEDTSAEVNPNPPAQSDMPNLQTGDQGG